MRGATSKQAKSRSVQKQAHPLFNGHAALQGPSPDSKTQGFNLYIFLQQREFNVIGSKLAKSPQTGTQAKESKNAL